MIKKRTRADIWKEIAALLEEIKVTDSTSPADFMPTQRREDVCAIARYFRDNPNQKSVMLSCTCRYCAVVC